MEAVDDGFPWDCGLECVHVDSTWPLLPGVAWWLFTLAAAFLVLTARTHPHLSLLEVAFASVPVGTIFAGWVTFLVSCLVNELGTISITISTAIIAYVAWDHWAGFRKAIGPAVTAAIAEAPSNWVLFLTLAAWGVVCVPLYLSRFFPEDEAGNVYSGGSCWADMPIHMHFATSFIYGRSQDITWSMQSPIFAGETLTYPFIPDWHAGVLYWMGDSFRHAMMWPGMAMFFSLLGLLYCFNRRLSRSDLAAALSTAFVVLAGGQGGIHLLAKHGYERVMQEFDPIQDDVGDKGNVFWFAFMPHVYLPQRGATFAYPMVLAAFLLVWAGTSRVGDVSLAARRRLIMLAALLCATLPMVQAHSFVGAGIVIGVVFLADVLWWLRDPGVLSAWLPAGVAAVTLAAPQLSQFLHMVTTGNGPSGKGSFMEFRPIWKPPGFAYDADVAHFFWFWWRSLGPAVPLAMAAFAWNALPALRGYSEAALAVGKAVFTKGAATAPSSPAVTAAAAPAEGAADADMPPPDAKAQTGALFGASSEPAFGAPQGAAVAYAGQAFPAGGKHPLGYLFGGGVQQPMDVEELYVYFQSVAASYAPVAAAAAAGDRAVQRFNGARDVDVFKWTAAGAAVWAFGNFVMLQPWDRDNCKLLYIALFILCGASADLLAWPFANAARAFLGRPQPGLEKAKAEDGTAPAAPVGHTVFSGERLPLRGSGGGTWRLAAHSAVALPLLLAAAAGIVAYGYYGCTSGALSVAREYRLYHVLYDADFKGMGEWIRRHVPPKAVMMHHDTHITPVGLYAGHSSLISYNGWMWSHGYDYYERDRDRKTVMDHMLKDRDQNAYNILRRWGVRYVLGENAFKWPREEGAPEYDPDVFLEGHLRRVHTSGRFELFEVLGYSFPPG